MQYVGISRNQIPEAPQYPFARGLAQEVIHMGESVGPNDPDSR